MGQLELTKTEERDETTRKRRQLSASLKQYSLPNIWGILFYAYYFIFSHCWSIFHSPAMSKYSVRNKYIMNFLCKFRSDFDTYKVFINFLGSTLHVSKSER